jgi:hypothetical protein
MTGIRGIQVLMPLMLWPFLMQSHMTSGAESFSVICFSIARNVDEIIHRLIPIREISETELGTSIQEI